MLNKLPFSLLIVLCLTLGLAPFQPEPHVWQKLSMLMSGELNKIIDIFDLFMHGAPWLLLFAKLVMMFKSSPRD